MLTGLILADGHPDGLAMTLGALVPAVVDGLMGDAVVIARRTDPAVATIAEIAGASLAAAPADADPWREGANLARRDWLLCLHGGDVPAHGWMRAVDHFLMATGGNHRPLGRFAGGAGFAGALSRFAEGMVGTRTVRSGDLVHRHWLVTHNGVRIRPTPIAARIERVR